METHTPEALKHARKLRREMSLPEVLLWQQLRQRPIGVKFRKQHPIGNLVVDFFCASKKLVIEIDGIAHNMGENPDDDVRRDAWLRSQGLEATRIPASDVPRDPASIAEALVRQCLVTPPPSALRAATSPNGGDTFGAVS